MVGRRLRMNEGRSSNNKHRHGADISDNNRMKADIVQAQ